VYTTLKRLHTRERSAQSLASLALAPNGRRFPPVRRSLAPLRDNAELSDMRHPDSASALASSGRSHIRRPLAEIIKFFSAIAEKLFGAI